MLHATEILGAETYDSFGNFVGRVKEMFVVPDEQPNRISRLLLGFFVNPVLYEIVAREGDVLQV